MNQRIQLCCVVLPRGLENRFASMATPDPEAPQGTIRFEADGYVSIAISGGLDDVPGPMMYPSGARMVVNRGGQDTGGAGHCIRALRVIPPATFDVKVEGSICSSLSATVRLNKHSVKQLPLIDDLASVRGYTQVCGRALPNLIFV